MKFPQATGSNLLRRKVTLPDDLAGQFNVLFVAFHQWHQLDVNTWIPLAHRIEDAVPGVQFYEIPVIQKLNIVAQTFINEGMRAGIPNSTTRRQTVTLYLDKPAFRRALDIPNEKTIWVLLLDHQGEVLWRTSGSYSQEKGVALLTAIREQITNTENPQP